MPINEDTNHISVIVPTYNRPKQLLETLNSLVKLPEIDEIIVVNDSPEVQIVFANHKVKIFVNDRNLGESISINNGYSKIKNRYFAIVSDDDPQYSDWLPNILKSLNDAPGYVAYYPSTRIIQKENVKEIILAETFDRTIFFKTLNLQCLAGVVVDRKKLPSTLINLRPNGVLFPNDLIQWLEISKYGDFFPVPNSYANWFSHDQQLSTTLQKHQKSKLYIENLIKWSTDNPSNLSHYLEAAILLRGLKFQVNKSAGFFFTSIKAFTYILRRSQNKLVFILTLPKVLCILLFEKIKSWKK